MRRAKVNVIAAELKFPGEKWNLAFKFEPAQEVVFNGTELKFAIGSWTIALAVRLLQAGRT
jgi:hypothetical protein